jgi:Protein of unknown function (DUF2778)
MQIIEGTFEEIGFDDDRAPRRGVLWLLPWGVALVFGAGMGGWIEHARAPAAPEIVAVARPAPATIRASKAVANPYGGLENPYGDLVNPYGPLVNYFQAAKPALASASPAVEASLDVIAPAPAVIPQPQEIPLPPKRDMASLDLETPLPPHRPAGLAPFAPQDRAASDAGDKTAATGPVDDRNIFQKLFGQRPAANANGNAAVAYAETEAPAASPPKSSVLAGTDRSSGFSFFGKSSAPTGYDQYTAVYDISAKVVYMPDGTKLEAHSGLGDRLDDPRFVSERGKGATPPHVYELTPREALFHGVQALRLTPVGEGGIYGRAGLLAHTYMLGPNGDSNGCVSFKDYDAFLHAFQQGQIKRLAVVAKVD